MNRTFGATAPCDWFSRMRDDRYRFAPAAVVMQFSGASVLSCMKGRDVLPAYREDVRTATRIFMDAGVPVVWVSTPLVRVSRASVAEINQIEQEAAAELGVTYVDAAAAVLDHGSVLPRHCPVSAARDQQHRLLERSHRGPFARRQDTSAPPGGPSRAPCTPRVRSATAPRRPPPGSLASGPGGE